MFFTNRILLVEGPTEKSLITRLIDDEKINVGNKSLFILDSLGKFNIHRFMNLMSKLGIDHYVLYDNDNASYEKYHTDINQLIHDSKTEFSLAVKDIENNLEIFLGIELKARLDQKPQHPLFQYGSGNICQEKIDGFCKIVEDLIS